MDDVYGVCPYCGFDAEAAVAYQSKQNNETLSPEEHNEEVEFYLYESHPDFCEGMRNSLKESETFEAVHDDYLISMKRNNPLSRHYIPPKKKYAAETFEAYNPEQPRDEGGRWISDEEMQSYITGAQFRRPSKQGSGITLRQLSEAVMATTHNHLDFDTAHELVNRMLSQHPAGDSQEARNALLMTLEETQMQLEYADEIGWDMDIEIMAGLLRSRGIKPPEEYEEAVINRLTFEDEWAAEEPVGYDKPLGESLNWTPYEYLDSKKNKPNKPTPAKDFDMADTFGRNVLLMSETFESSNYKCSSCGTTFAQEDTQEIDGDIICDDCIYDTYDIDEFDVETFSPNRKGNWETGDFINFSDISELITDAQDMGCLVTSYNAREVLDSVPVFPSAPWHEDKVLSDAWNEVFKTGRLVVEIYTDYKYTDNSKNRFNYEHKFVYDFEFNDEEELWELESLEQPYAISLAYPYHMQYIVQSTDPDEAAEMAYRGEGKRSDVGDLSKSPIFTWPSSVDWQPNPVDARPLFD